MRRPSSLPFDVGDFAAVASLDRDRRAALDLPIDGRRGERDVERDVIVARRQRLRVGPDLVRDVTAGGRSISADDAQINEALSHHVTRGIVDDDRVRDPVLAELPSGKAGALIARPRLVDPDMDWDAILMSTIDRGEGCTPIDGGEPAGITVSKDLDPPCSILAAPGLGD